MMSRDTFSFLVFFVIGRSYSEFNGPLIYLLLLLPYYL